MEAVAFVATLGFYASLAWLTYTFRQVLDRLEDERRMLNEIVNQKVQLDAKVRAWRTDTVEAVRMVLTTIPGPLRDTAASEMRAIAREQRMSPALQELMEEAIERAVAPPEDLRHGVN
jgi:hypothetical protein